MRQNSEGKQAGRRELHRINVMRLGAHYAKLDASNAKFVKTLRSSANSHYRFNRSGIFLKA